MSEPIAEVHRHELSTFYKRLFLGVTYSELDRPEKGPVCYLSECPLDEEQLAECSKGLDFTPLIFQSLFTVRTRTGSVHCYVFYARSSVVLRESDFRPFFVLFFCKALCRCCDSWQSKLSPSF